MEKVRIGHDGRGLGTGWYLEEVVIIVHDECWIFPCNQWLADYEDDGKTERDLFAGKFETDLLQRLGMVCNVIGSHLSHATNQENAPNMSRVVLGCFPALLVVLASTFDWLIGWFVASALQAHKRNAYGRKIIAIAHEHWKMY